jgi:hypothetical protein
MQSLMAASSQAGSQIRRSHAVGKGQQLDAKQSALITQALSRAMKASGQSAEIAMQSQAASLMTALQQQSLGQTHNANPSPNCERDSELGSEKMALPCHLRFRRN